ncbi:MAG: TetR/AcrR family transcriptional regulator [Clostridia bacterium]|nr:TetR/AcrR family transcriptional regulator [Clostridia bacterium]
MAVQTHIYAKDRIFNAYCELISKHYYSAISTTAIIELSGVSRQTFYRIYEDKTNLAVLHCYSLFSQIETMLSKESTIKDLLLLVLTVVQNNPVIFAHYYLDEEGRLIPFSATERLQSKWGTLPSSTWASTLVNSKIITAWATNRFSRPKEEVYTELLMNMPAKDLLSRGDLSVQVEKYGQRRIGSTIKS